MKSDRKISRGEDNFKQIPNLGSFFISNAAVDGSGLVHGRIIIIIIIIFFFFKKKKKRHKIRKIEKKII